MVQAGGVRIVDNRRLSPRTNDPVPACPVKPETAEATTGGQWISHRRSVITSDSCLRSPVLQDRAGSGHGRIRDTVWPRRYRTFQPGRTYTEKDRRFRNRFRHVHRFNGVRRLSVRMVIGRRDFPQKSGIGLGGGHDLTRYRRVGLTP